MFDIDQTVLDRWGKALAEAIDADIMEWVRAGQPEEWTGNPVFELEPGRMMTMKEAKESELIRQPCVERMCFRYDEKSGVFIYCEDLRLVEGGELKACMPSSENKSECVCNCYAYPEAWNRKGGCPRSTVPYEIDRPKKVKKVNPLKASKRGAR